VREDALLMDVTSIKREPLEAMLAAMRTSVVGTHPIFDPSVHSLQGQRIVLTRGRGDAWFDWPDEMLRARGLSVMEASAEDHNRAMSVVRVLTHFSTEVLGRTLADLSVSIEETPAFTSPVYLMELLMTARHFAQSPDLYASIQMSNSETPAVTRAFVEAARRHHDAIASGRTDEIRKMFDGVRRCFGPFTDQALEQSSFLIDRLVERT